MTNTCYEQLVSCCKRIAEEKGLKPHHIFADVTLRQMADKLPMTREEMLDLEGVTEYKMDQFGQQFLEVCVTIKSSMYMYLYFHFQSINHGMLIRYFQNIGNMNRQYKPFLFQLTLAYGGCLLASDSDMIGDFDDMMIDSDRTSTGNDCGSPYWASSGNFPVGNKKSKFKRRGKFQSKKKTNKTTTSK